MKRDIWISALFALGVCVLVSIFGEIGARVLQLSPPSLITLDSCTGYKNLPNAHGVVAGPLGLIPVTTNSEGFRDTKHDLQKPQGTYRVLLLGDSFTEAIQVSQDDTFWHKLQADADAQNLKLDIVTMGISSFDTAQEVLAYECYGRQYHADLVVLDYNSYDLIENYFYNEPFTPKFSEQNGTLVLDTSYKDRVAQRLRERSSIWPGILYWVKDNSALARHLFLKYQNSKVGDAVTNAVDGQDPAQVEFLPGQAAQLQPAWQLLQALLTRLTEDAAADHARVLFINFPALQQYGADRQGLDLSVPDMGVGDIAQQLGIPFLNLRPSLVAAQSTEPVHFDNDPHLTAYGHTVTAKALLDEIQLIRKK